MDTLIGLIDLDALFYAAFFGLFFAGVAVADQLAEKFWGRAGRQ